MAREMPARSRFLTAERRTAWGTSPVRLKRLTREIDAQIVVTDELVARVCAEGAAGRRATSSIHAPRGGARGGPGPTGHRLDRRTRPSIRRAQYMPPSQINRPSE